MRRFQLPSLKMLFAFLPLALVALLSACPGNGGNVCACSICRDAVSLTVQDSETGAPVIDFLVEVVHNDTTLGEPNSCTADVRDGTNACAFGDDPGLYKIVIQAPDYETREATVRIAEEEASEICCAACLRSRETTIDLTRVQLDG